MAADELDSSGGGRSRRPRRADVTTNRRAVRRRRRRRAVLGVVAAVLGVVAVAVVVVLVAGWLDRDADEPGEVATESSLLPSFDDDDQQPTLLLATFDDTATDQRATHVVLLGDRADGATAVLVPTTTVAEVPGHGPLQLGEAHALGATPLLQLTVDNLLGIDTDGAVGISRQAWAQFFARFGGLELDVPEPLTLVTDGGERRVRFEPGPQFLDGERVAEYLTFRQPGESELQQLPRVQRVLVAMLDATAAEPSRLDGVFVDGAPFLDTAEPDRLRELLLAMAEARAADELEIRTLPVEAIGSGEQSSYRLDEERARELIETSFAGSLPTGDRAGGRRLQILNGNGEPGIGQAVAERLQPGGYRVVLTRNADRFDYDTTRIVVYADTPEQLALARDVRERLGVGEVEVSQTPQRVADITVVVGRDFTG